MRLKKNHTGWRSSGLWKKYLYPSVDERKSVKSKKNTKRWCRGKRGEEHDYVLMRPKNAHEFLDIKLPICSKCEKQDYHNVVYKNEKTGRYEPLHLKSIL